MLTGVLFIAHHRFHEIQQVSLAGVWHYFTMKSILVAESPNLTHVFVEIIKFIIITQYMYITQTS